MVLAALASVAACVEQPSQPGAQSPRQAPQVAPAAAAPAAPAAAPAGGAEPVEQQQNLRGKKTGVPDDGV